MYTYALCICPFCMIIENHREKSNKSRFYSKIMEVKRSWKQWNNGLTLFYLSHLAQISRSLFLSSPRFISHPPTPCAIRASWTWAAEYKADQSLHSREVGIRLWPVECEPKL